MAIPEVEQYIANERARGVSRQAIESALKQSGWNDEDIAKGFAAIDQSSQDDGTSQENSPSPSNSGANTSVHGSQSPPDTSVHSTGDAASNESFPGPIALLGEAFRYAGRRFWLLLGVAVVFIVINLVIQLGVALSFGTASVLLLFLGNSSGFFAGSALILFTLLAVIVFVEYWFVASFLVALQSPQPSFGHSLKRGLKLTWPILLIQAFLSLVLLGASIPFMVPAVLFAFWFSFALFVAIDEDKRGYAALAQSYAYMRERTGGVLGRLLFLVLPYIVGLIILFMAGARGDTGSTEAGLISTIIILVTFLALVLFYGFVAPSYIYLIYRHLKRINPNPEPAQRMRGWAIGLSIWGIVAMIAFFALTAGTSFGLQQNNQGGPGSEQSSSQSESGIFAGLAQSRRQGAEAEIKFQIQSLRALFGVYEHDNGSYVGACSSNDIRAELDVVEENPLLTARTTCNTTSDSYAVSAEYEMEGETYHYCSDSTSFFGPTVAALGSAVKCPDEAS